MVRPRNTGFVLALVLFIIVVLAIVAFAALSVTTLDQRTSQEDYKAARALYAARAGVAQAQARLAWDHNWTGGSGSLEGDAFTATATPHPDNSGGTGDLMWRVTSTGSSDGASRTVVAWLRVETFAKYAYFTEREYTSSNQEIWFFDRDQITGATHTNGWFRVSGHPRFSAAVASANGGDPRYNATNFTYNQEGIQRDPARFYQTYRNYASDSPVALGSSPHFSFAGGQSSVPLPTDTGAVAANANRTYTRETRLTFLGDGRVDVDEYRSGRWRDVEILDTTTSPGVVLYVSNEVHVSGTVQGRVTVGASEDVHITGDLVYADASRDVLGIVGEQNVIVESSPYSRVDRYIHATMMALNGSFTINDYSTGVYRGVLHVFGGIVQNRRGPVGTFSGTSPVTGYSKDYVYDEKLLNNAPLYFPPTGNVEVRSLIDRGSLGAS